MPRDWGAEKCGVGGAQVWVGDNGRFGGCEPLPGGREAEGLWRDSKMWEWGGTCDRGWVVVTNLARLTIRAAALSCTSAGWEMAKGSRSWERRRKAAAVPGRRHGTACHSLACCGRCLGWGMCPCPSQQPAVSRQVTVSCCCLCCLTLLPPAKTSLHPHPRLWGDHLPGNLWSVLWDAAHGGGRG